MKWSALGILLSAAVLNQGRSFASEIKLSQINIPVPNVDEMFPAPQPSTPPAAPLPDITPSPQSPGTSTPPENGGAASSAFSGVSDDLYFLTRAKNLARQAAINENGGLMLYRPEYSMYGPALQSPFRQNDDGSVTFTFKGGAPGASTLDQETEVKVDGNVGVTIVYNGPSRGTADPTPSSENASALAALDEDSFIARARNLARQAGIATNGGLRVYRPEASMFGPTSSAPFVKNEDGSVTFTFKGGAPAAPAPSQETAVTVSRDGTVTVDFNRPI